MDERLVSFFKTKNWWFDEAAESYGDLLAAIGLDRKSMATTFYLHVEDGPSFLTEHGEIHQLGWHLEHTNYVENAKQLIATLGLSKTMIPLDNFAAGAGYFYDSKTGSVIYIALGQNLARYHADEAAVSWPDFETFLLWYFGLNEKSSTSAPYQ